jgi:hypothetical protein
MGTRGQIQVEGSKVLLYVHSDAYPSGILPTLLPFVAKFIKGRGDDPEFMSARILQAFMNAYDAEFPDDYENHLSGFGVDTEIHGDTEYMYFVKPGGAVDVKKMRAGGIIGSFPVGTDPMAALKQLGDDGT